MSIAETNRIVPKSVLRYRPFTSELGAPSIPAWSVSKLRASCAIQVKRATSTKNSPRFSPGKRRLPFYQSHQIWHWTVPVGLTLMGIVLLTLTVQLAWNWGTELYNDLHYNMPRTTQVDAYVGHGVGKTPSHFIAENLKGRMLVIEFPGGDVQHARMLVGPRIMGPQADQVPVLLSFVYRNGNHLPDMSVQFGSIEMWYANVQGTFVPQ